MLRFPQEDAPNTLKKNHLPSMERLRNVLQTKGEEVHALKVKITESRIEKGKEDDGIRKYNQIIEADMTGIEETVTGRFANVSVSLTVSSPTTWDDSPTFLCHILCQFANDLGRFANVLMSHLRSVRQRPGSIRQRSYVTS